MKKTTLLASFIDKNKVNSFIQFLVGDFKIKKEKIFIYKTNENEDYILTFKLNKENNSLDINRIIPKPILIHKKKSTFYTINALNKLIENQISYKNINLKYQEIKVDFSKYNNAFIYLKHKELTILKIERVFNVF